MCGWSNPCFRAGQTVWKILPLKISPAAGLRKVRLFQGQTLPCSSWTSVPAPNGSTAFASATVLPGFEWIIHAKFLGALRVLQPLPPVVRGHSRILPNGIFVLRLHPAVAGDERHFVGLGCAENNPVERVAVLRGLQRFEQNQFVKWLKIKSRLTLDVAKQFANPRAEPVRQMAEDKKPADSGCS